MKISTNIYPFLSIFSSKNLFATGVFLAFLAQAAQAQYSIGGKSYVPYGNTETVTALFSNPKGSLTAKTYSGLVLVKVTGTGQSPADNYNDAFYIYKGFFKQDSFFYQLGATTQPTLHLNKANNAVKQVVFDADAGKEAYDGYVPAYREDHSYSFVIDMNLMVPAPKTPAPIRFGLIDGIYSDNTGSFKITLSQLQHDVDADCDKVLDACDACPNNDDSVDNNQDGIADCGQLLDFADYAQAWKPVNNKIIVCNNGQTMTISKDMLSTRFAMGYRVGPCSTCATVNRNLPSEELTLNTAPVMSISPNPAVDMLNITLDKALDSEASLRVVDQSGRVVYSQQWQPNMVQMRVNLLPNKFAAGIYTVQLINNEVVLNEQVTVVRQ